MEWVKIEEREFGELGYSAKGTNDPLPGYYLVTDGENFGVFRHGAMKGMQFRSLFFKDTWKRGKLEKHNWTHYFPVKLEAPSNVQGNRPLPAQGDEK